MSLDLSSHKEHQYMWFRGGDLNILRYKAFYEPQLESMVASYHKEHDYVWVNGGDLKRFSKLYGGRGIKIFRWKREYSGDDNTVRTGMLEHSS